MTTDIDETHEFTLSVFVSGDRCAHGLVVREGYASNACGQPKDAPIHRVAPDYIVTVAPEGVSVRKPEDRVEGETPSVQCDRCRNWVPQDTVKVQAGVTFCAHCQDGFLDWVAAQAPAVPATPEARETPPERIWIRPGDAEYSPVPLNYNNDDVEYILRSVHDSEMYAVRNAATAYEECFASATQYCEQLENQVAKLREALRGLSVRFNRKDEKCPECWCNAWDWTKHKPECAAARSALKGGDDVTGI